MKSYNNEYENIVSENFNKCKKTYIDQTEYIKNSTAKYHGRVVKTLCIPKLFSKEQVEYLKHIAEYTHKILSKTIVQYREDEEFRKKFMFPKKLESLILLDNSMSSELPVARVDIFLNEETGDFKFCEINTDGTSAMNEDRELNIAIAKTYAYDKFSEKHSLDSFELFDSFVTEFLDMYNSYSKRVEKPNVAIVDFLNLGTTNEFEQFKNAFMKCGINTEICEITELEYRDGILYSPTGMKIDVIYRRAVTCDIMENDSKITPFLNAVFDGNVCLIGPISTQVAHSKILFSVLSDVNNLNYLNDEEKQFVEKYFPKTYNFVSNSPLFDIESVSENKDNWILKPVDSYGSRGVFAGVEGDAKQWKEHLTDCLDRGYILQEFCKPYETFNVDFAIENPQLVKYSNLSGLFVYNGKFKGVYSRVSKTEIISTQYSEVALPTVVVE